MGCPLRLNNLLYYCHQPRTIDNMLRSTATQSRTAQPRARTAGHTRVFRNEGIGRSRLFSTTITTSITFGVELELFFPSNVSVEDLSNALSRARISGWR